MEVYNTKNGSLTLRELKTYLDNLSEEVLDAGAVVIEDGMQHSKLCASIVREQNTLLFSAYLWEST